MLLAQFSAVGQLYHPYEPQGVTDMDFWLHCDVLHLNPLALELDIYSLAHHLCKM
jgi:hypothetical protein